MHGCQKNEDSIIEYQLRPEVKFGENIHPEEINLLKDSHKDTRWEKHDTV